MKGRSHDVGTLVSDIVLHSSLRVDPELNTLIDGSTQSSVILAGIFVVGIVLGVVYVVFWTVAAEAIGRDLEFLRTISKSQEAENAEK